MQLKFMKIAISQAKKALEIDEVPIGACIVKDGKVISKAFNKTEGTQDATSHAEVLAIKKACKKLKSWRLDGADIYVTVEPCAMCAGAIVNARIKNVYFGAYENKSGCATSLYPVLTNNGSNHKTEFIGGVEEEVCSTMLKDYFKSKRKSKKL